MSNVVNPKFVFGVGLLQTRTSEIPFGFLQNVTVEFGGDLKTIYGGDILFPAEGEIANRTIEISVEYAQIDVNDLQKLVGGVASDSGSEEVITGYEDSDLDYFGLQLMNPTAGTDLEMIFYRVKPTGSVSIPLVRDDFVIVSCSFQAFRDETEEGNKVFQIVLK